MTQIENVCQVFPFTCFSRETFVNSIARFILLVYCNVDLLGVEQEQLLQEVLAFGANLGQFVRVQLVISLHDVVQRFLVVVPEERGDTGEPGTSSICF